MPDEKGRWSVHDGILVLEPTNDPKNEFDDPGSHIGIVRLSDHEPETERVLDTGETSTVLHR